MVTSTASLKGASPASSNQIAGGKGYNLKAEDFIKMMITQLQNQDPLQPTGSDQLLSQMSQIGQMQSASSLQTTLQGLAQQNQIGAASSLIGKTVQEVLECDLQLEQLAMPQLREAIPYCERVRDFVSRDLFSKILESEEEHVDFIETQLDLIIKIGVENYIQLQSQPAE